MLVSELLELLLVSNEKPKILHPLLELLELVAKSVSKSVMVELLNVSFRVTPEAHRSLDARAQVSVPWKPDEVFGYNDGASKFLFVISLQCDCGSYHCSNLPFASWANVEKCGVSP